VHAVLLNIFSQSQAFNDMKTPRIIRLNNPDMYSIQ